MRRFRSVPHELVEDNFAMELLNKVLQKCVVVCDPRYLLTILPRPGTEEIARSSCDSLCIFVQFPASGIVGPIECISTTVSKPSFP